MKSRGKPFQKGHKINIGNQWNKNKKHSIETKMKMSKSAKISGTGKWMLGKKHTEETKRKISKSRTGYVKEKSSNWKGGISLNQKEYQNKRKEKKAGRKKPEQCELCGSLGQICFDHDHKTGEFRGWICHRCNIVLGLVKDNSELLLVMIKYINK